MSTENNNELELTLPINTPTLNDVAYGQSINNIITNINNNFQYLVESDYFRGPKGESIDIITYNVTDSDPDNNGISIAEDILDKIINKFEDAASGLTSSDVIGDITIVYEKDDMGNLTQISSLPFVFMDPRFRNPNNYSTLISENIEDCSCIIQWNNSIDSETNEVIGYEIIPSFPTLYYDRDLGHFCWKVNGIPTGLIAEGPQGVAGKNGTMHIVKVIESTEVSNKYKVERLVVSTDITDEEWISSINNGEPAFVAKLNSNNEYEYYMGVIKTEDDGVYTIINNNSIYNQFVGINFEDFLKRIYIDNTDGIPKGLFLPINKNDNSGHILCAVPVFDNSIEEGDSRINLNIAPVSDIDDIDAGDISVVRNIVISAYSPGSSTLNTYDLIFSNIITDISGLQTSLGNMSSQDSYVILTKVTGISISNDTELNKNIEDIFPIYCYSNGSNIKLYSNNINIYPSQLSSYALVMDNSLAFSSLNNIEKNNTYIKNTSIENDKTLQSSSINFGYNNINIGSSIINNGAEEYGKTNVNICGNLSTSEDIYSNNIQCDTLDVRSIKKTTIQDPNINGDINIDGDINASGNLMLGNNNINITNYGDLISKNDLNIKSINNGKLNIDIPSNISKSVNVNYGDTSFEITNKNIDGYKTNWNSDSTITKYFNQTIDNNNNNISENSNTSGSWRKHADPISKTYTLKYICTYEGAETQKIEFNPIVISFTYQGRSYRNGKTDCPRFPYSIKDIEMVIKAEDGVSFYKTCDDCFYAEQIKFTSGNGGTYFADSSSGTTYTDYLKLYLPSINISKGDSKITDIEITFKLAMDGDNAESVWTTVGDFRINSLYTTYSRDSVSYIYMSSPTDSKPDNVSKFITETVTFADGIRTVICSDGIIIGTSKDSYSSLKWKSDSSGSKLRITNAIVEE